MTASVRWDSLWVWLGVAVLIHLMVVIAWYDFPTRNAAKPSTAKRMTVRMAIARAIAPELPKEQPPTPIPPKPTQKPAPNPAAPTPAPPPEITQPVIEQTPVVEAAEVAAVDTEALLAEQRAMAIESEKASYVDQVRARIEARKRYPSMARRRAIEGVVLTRFHIAEDGSVLDLSTDDAAASILNRSARQAVERAAPFPAPPHGAIVIEVPIRYDLED